MKKLDISNARERVQEALDRVGKLVVVFVDDVDRLPPAEVRLLFQFLKAVADFRGVSYVIAYDPTPVEQALSFEGKLDGREYLKELLSILHHWGQFPNNDYAEPQKYMIRFSEQNDPLLLLQRSGGGVDVGLLENVPGAYPAILSGLSKHNSQPELREMTANMIRQLQARTASLPVLPVLPISRGEFGSRE